MSAAPHLLDRNRMSDFSIERILSAQVGTRPDRCLQDLHAPGGHCLDPAPLSLLVPVPVPVPGCVQYRGMGFEHALHPFCGVFVRVNHTCAADLQPVPGYHGHDQATVRAPPPPPPPQHQQRPKARMRTVFTDSQTTHLEALFRVTDYPTVEERHELATSTGLREETVRVWFKNRRARRKCQGSGSKVKSTPHPPSTDSNSFLVPVKPSLRTGPEPSSRRTPTPAPEVRGHLPVP